VPEERLELSHLSIHDFESCASTIPPLRLIKMSFDELLTLARFVPFFSGPRAHSVWKLFGMQERKGSIRFCSFILPRIMLLQSSVNIIRYADVNIISGSAFNRVCIKHSDFRLASP
jgi:hypothetical protein